jgi:hypothetical protein
MQLFDETGIPVGSNTRVNDDFTGFAQSYPACAIDEAGKSVVTWQDPRLGAGDSRIFAQGFDQHCQPLSGNVIVSANRGYMPQACMTALSTAVITWSGTATPDPGPWHIFAREFDISGIPIGEPVSVSEILGNNRHSNCATNTNGYIAVTWWQYDEPHFNLYSQRLNPDLTWIGDNIQINDVSLSMYGDVIPGIAFSAVNNRVLYVWSDEREEPSWDTYGCIYDFSSGIPATDNYRINDDRGALSQGTSDILSGGPSVNASCFDRHVVVWVDTRDNFNFHIYGQLYEGAGNALGSNFIVSEGISYATNPSVAMAINGDFVVAYEVLPWNHLYARRYNRDGIPYGPSFQVDDTEPNQDNICWYPAVAFDEEGKFVIAWEDYRGPDPVTRARGLIGVQCYDRDGSPISGNYLLGLGPNADDPAPLWHPDIAVTNSDLVMVTCMGFTGESEFDIYCWRICPIYPLAPYIVNTNTENFQQKPVVASNGEELFVVWLDDYDGDWHYDVYGQRVGSDGTPIGENFLINERANPYHYFEWPTICTSLSGGYIISWADNSEPDWNVYAQGMDGSGELIGNCMRINFNNEPFGYCHQTNPGVSSNEIDVFFVWHDNRRQKGYDIYGNFLPRSSFWITDDPLSLAYNGNRHFIRKPISTDLHMVCTDQGNVLYRNSSDGGSNWSASEIIGAGAFPSIALDPGHLPSAAWTDDEGGLWYGKLNALGWSTYHLHDPSPYQPYLNTPPSIVVTRSLQGDTVHILASLYLEDIEHLFGAVVEYSFPISNPPAYTVNYIEGGSAPNHKFCYHPSLTKDYQEQLHAVWQRGDTICYATREVSQNWNNWGWQFRDKGLQSAHPFVETYGDRVFVVWQHPETSGRDDVYRGWRFLTGEFQWHNLSETYTTVSAYPVNASGLATTFIDEEQPPPPDGQYEVYWKRIPDDPLNNISTSPRVQSIYPHTSLRYNQIADNELFIIWQEGNTAPYQIKCEKVYVPDTAPAFFSSRNGTAEPSAYVTMRDTFNSTWQIPADIGTNELKYRFVLEPGYGYTVKAVLYQEFGSQCKARFTVDNNLEYVVQYNSAVPKVVEAIIPPRLYADSVIEVSMQKISGAGVALGPVYIYRYEDASAGGVPGGPMAFDEYSLKKGSVLVAPTVFAHALTIRTDNTATISVCVYDVTGRLVRNLGTWQTEGAATMTWAGDDEAGLRTPAGIYFVQVTDQHTGEQCCHKVLKIK